MPDGRRVSASVCDNHLLLRPDELLYAPLSKREKASLNSALISLRSASITTTYRQFALQAGRDHVSNAFNPFLLRCEDTYPWSAMSAYA